MLLIDKEINYFLNKKFASNDSISLNNSIQLFFFNQMSDNYKQDESQLIKIIKRFVIPTESDKTVKLTIYYKAKKLKSLFIKNNSFADKDTNMQHHVVYQYSCPRDDCNATHSYIGLTTCTVLNRFKCTRRNRALSKSISKTSIKLIKLVQKISLKMFKSFAIVTTNVN